jgi:hypothetical protein
LYPALRQDGIDSAWLDKRTMDPVGRKEKLDLPKIGKPAAGLKACELKMASGRMERMIRAWKPEGLRGYIARSDQGTGGAKKGGPDRERLAVGRAPGGPKGANFIDLVEPVKKSLGTRRADVGVRPRSSGRGSSASN